MIIDPQRLASLWSQVKSHFFAQGEAAVLLAEQLLHSLGPLRHHQGELWAGRHSLHHDQDLLLRLAQATGLGYALYFDHRCIAAVGPGQSRAELDELKKWIGQHASHELSNLVLHEAKVFAGPLYFEQVERIAVVRPLFRSTSPDRNEVPLGMLEVFQSEHFFQQSLLGSLASSEHSDRSQLFDVIEPIRQFLDDLARRLQLLALNGNIIAAQAGEQGRAFRVVCQELGALAQRAKSTSQDVHTLVRDTQHRPSLRT